jgi:hypothetical protein
MTADQEGPRGARRKGSDALAADMEKYPVGKPRKEVRDMSESRSKDDESGKGKGDRELLAWVVFVIALVVAWTRR